MQDSRTESTLKGLGLKYEYWAEYPLSKIRIDPQTQVRLAGNQAPAPEVKRYRDLLRAGVEFPPVVLLKDDRLVDGNTRFKAYSEHGQRQVIPAYRIDTTSVAIAKRLGVELNAQHGKRMLKEELAQWLAGGNGSVSEEDALRLTGWSATTVRRVRGALQFEAKRTRLGVELGIALPEAVRAKLAGAENPQVFRDLTLLAADAGLTAGEISIIRKHANDVARMDVDAALRYLSELREENAQRIQERAAGLRVITPVYRQMALHLGWVINQGPFALHDTNEYTAVKSKALIERAISVLREARDRYE